MARKAFALEDKDDRRRLILATAAKLFLEGGCRLPSTAAIAAACGLAKGTVYIYFSSKGAIFAELQAEGWRGLRSAVDRATVTASGSQAAMVATIIAGLVAHLRDHPELPRLDSLGHGVIVPNATVAELMAFKVDQMDMLTVSATQLDQALSLPPGKGLRILLRSYALIRGLWQSLPFDGGVSPSSAEFQREIEEALHEYWRGALT